ncbi:MAG: ATP-binding protein [Gemmatimonadetes bacterium]|nr:ATP-binding protein [Gemmatimonadota bacterium]
MRLDARLRFDTLVVGAGNRLAVAAARAVAESPGTVYNPLFIYGGTGLGKTHLLGGIGHLAEALQPGSEVEYVTLEEFVGQLLAATSTGQIELFSRRYERCSVLLIDDVQFLTGHREMQAELLKLFERMQRAGRQIVLTSDRPPAEIRDVDERLISRLSGGLIVDVTAPDFETRVAILRANCEERHLTFKEGVLEELAQFSFGNVRELQGALNRLVAHQALGVDDAPRPAQPAGRPTGEFEDFLSDVSSVVQEHVESWQARLAEARQYWQGEGYKTGVIERALTLPREPDVAGLLATFAAAIEHLRNLERTATSVDPSLGGNSVFRDPERMAEAEDLVERALAGATPPDGPSPAFVREAFEVSSSNQLAAHAADTVVAEPGTKYNPLLFHGPSGVGKTHLLNAIGNALLASSGGRMVVACVHAQKFIDELIAAIQGGTIERWRLRYRHADALIIDDVQFVAGKERTQDELFLLFNALAGAGKQIVLTSDRTPAEIPDLEARLRSRFEGGLVVPIQAPDRTLRQRLFARYLADAGRPADDALLTLLADQPVQSVREIVGVVNRLGAAADASRTPISVQLARAELGLATPYAGVLAVSTVATRDSVPYDAEKIVWEWPDATARLIEELR